MTFIRAIRPRRDSHTMASRSHAPSRSWMRYARDKKPSMSRGLKAAWALFIVVGLPLGIAAVLGYLAYAGIYVEWFRQFWRPWPSELVKSLLAIAGFAAILGNLFYRSGRERGFRSGKMAGKAAARNAEDALAALPAPLVEVSKSAPQEAVQATSVLPDAPLPPPQ